MRYQVQIIRKARRRLFRKDLPGPIWNYGSSKSLEGALILLANAPFYSDEMVVVLDREDGSWQALKRGKAYSGEKS